MSFLVQARKSAASVAHESAQEDVKRRLQALFETIDRENEHQARKVIDAITNFKSEADVTLSRQTYERDVGEIRHVYDEAMQRYHEKVLELLNGLLLPTRPTSSSSIHP